MILDFQISRVKNTRSVNYLNEPIG